MLSYSTREMRRMGDQATAGFVGSHGASKIETPSAEGAAAGVASPASGTFTAQVPRGSDEHEAKAQVIATPRPTAATGNVLALQVLIERVGSASGENGSTKGRFQSHPIRASPSATSSNQTVSWSLSPSQPIANVERTSGEGAPRPH